MTTQSPGRDISGDSGATRALLEGARTIAVVGLSDNPSRPSYGVAAAMQRHGYRIVPVNPTLSAALGEPAYPDLASLPFPVDIVDIFRRPEHVPAVVEEAISIGAPAVWMQLGVSHPDAVRRALAAGLVVVAERCIKVEYARLMG
ncbi:MAG: CoA-binding protein [Chloroflexales bacterium]|nr:CoA-binding protein [Chloroflexales bacterium]